MKNKNKKNQNKMLFTFCGGITRKLSFNSSLLSLPSSSLPLFLLPTVMSSTFIGTGT